MNDYWITFFMEVTHLLSSCFQDTGYPEGSKAETDSFRKISEAISELERKPDMCGFMLIRSRGLGEKPMAAGADEYELVARDFALDTAVTPTKIREAGSRMSFFAGRLTQAFEVFSANNITSIYVKAPWRLPDDVERLRLSLRILSGFVQAVKTDAPVAFVKNDEQVSLPVVKDEKGRPHPNLTLVMGLNNLDPVKMQDMIKKVDIMMGESDPGKASDQFIDVYDALKCSPIFQQLMKPPVEINNFRWMISDSETDNIPGERIQVVKSVAAIAQDSPHKAAHILAGIYGNDFEKINARILGERLIQITEFLNAIGEIKKPLSKEIHESVLSRFTQVRREVRDQLTLKDTTLFISSKDHDIPLGEIDPEFVKMIRFFGSNSLPKDESAQRKKKINRDKSAELANKAAETIEEKSVKPAQEIKQPDVRKPVRISSDVKASARKVAIGPAGEEKKETAPKNIRSERKVEQSVEERAIQRPTAKKSAASERSSVVSSQMEKLVGDRIDQMELDDLTHAEETEPSPMPIPPAIEERADSATEEDRESEDIVIPFKRCFDSRGHFQKGFFEENIPALAKHREQAFEFIWQYLRGTMNREDRLALLSSLHLLVNKINQSEKAVSVLLNDIFREPNKVDISDRNGLMLASLVIRKYNKEFNKEMELTPEEVFLVKEGLIGSAVQTASKIIETHPENIMQKQITVYSGITQSLGLKKDDSASMPFRYLLNLEREACIFLSLVGGPTPRAILRDALNVYGNPDSEIYKTNGDSAHITAFFQHLKILVRGLGRVGEKEDIPVLEALKNNEQGFMRFCQDAKSQDMILRILKWADDSAKHLEVNSDK